MNGEEVKVIVDRRRMDPDLIKEIFDHIEEHHLCVDDGTHKMHHEFVRMLIDEHERKIRRWDKIREQVTGWAIIAFLGALGSAVYGFILNTKSTIK